MYRVIGLILRSNIQFRYFYVLKIPISFTYISKKSSKFWGHTNINKTKRLWWSCKVVEIKLECSVSNFPNSGSQKLASFDWNLIRSWKNCWSEMNQFESNDPVCTHIPIFCIIHINIRHSPNNSTYLERKRMLQLLQVWAFVEQGCRKVWKSGGASK